MNDNLFDVDHKFLTGGGEMGELTRSMDWSLTPVGEVGKWPQSLRTTLSIILNSGFPMFLWWGKDLVCFYNDAYRPSLGQNGKHPSILGMPAIEAWPEIWDIIKPLIDQVLYKGESVWHEDRLVPIFRNGKIEDVYWTFSYSPVNDESGNAAGVLVTCTETTEKVNNLRALKESKDELSFAIEATELGTFDYDPASGKFSSNSRLKDWFGLPAHSRNELSVALDAIAPDDRARVEQAINRAMDFSSGGKYEIEYSVIHPETHNETIVRAKGRAWFNDNNEVYRFNGTIQDVTNEVRGRRQIEESEKRFRNFIEQAPIGIIIFKGNDYVVEMANNTYLEIIAKNDDELIGRPFFDSLPTLEATIKPLFETVYKTGKPYFGTEFPVDLFRHGRSETAYFNFVYQPLIDEKENVTGIIVIATEVTTAVNAKHALEESETQFRRMVMQSPIPMAILRGKDFRIELANTRMVNEIWYRSLDEVIGKPLVEMFPELKEQKFPGLMDEVYSSGIPHKEYEALTLVKMDDELKEMYLNFEYAPLLGPGNEVDGLFVTINDVTENVRSRKALEESEQRIRALIDSAPFPIAVYIGKEMRIMFANKTIMDVWGKGDDVIGKLYTEILPELENQEIFQQVEGVFNSGVPFHARNQRVDLVIDGVLLPFYFNYSFTPLYNSTGEVYGVMNTAADVTDLNLALIGLRESEESFRLLADSMPQFVWSSGPDGKLTYFNQSVFNYSGLLPADLFNDGWIQMVHPDDRQKNMDLWLQSVSTGKDFHCEHRFRRSDGVYRWQLSRAVPQYNESGSVKQWVGTSTDIQDQKESVNELERQVSERTKQLEEKNIDLEKMNKELQSFAYISSHDLQEPLRKIQTFSGRILDKEYENLTDTGKDYFNRMKESAKRMQSLIDDLLAYSRTHASDLKFEHVHLNKIVEDVSQDIKEELDQKGGTIESEELCDLNIIPFQFRQLFYNLFSNSMKFTRPGIPPHIKVGCKIDKGAGFHIQHLKPDETYCHIHVSDNGVGFEPQYSERIFEVFQRLHGRGDFPGTGIGLAIVKKIVENHNGFISATGRLNEGATFNIFIPIT